MFAFSAIRLKLAFSKISYCTFKVYTDVISFNLFTPYMLSISLLHTTAGMLSMTLNLKLVDSCSFRNEYGTPRNMHSELNKRAFTYLTVDVDFRCFLKHVATATASSSQVFAW